MTASLANMYSPQSIRRRGFTLLELLAVIATIGTLAALLLPILGKAKIKAQRTKDVSNLRQLGFAWVMYKDDNDDYLAESYQVNNPYALVQGNVTNLAEAGNANLIRQGKLYDYNQNVAIYRCPADQGVLIDGKVTPTVRSYSMNCFMGARDPSLGPIPYTAGDYVPFYSTYHEIPRPSQMWVLIEEDERSINDGFFVTDPTDKIWFDFPANSAQRHNYSFALAFAGGHADSWGYRDPRTRLVKANRIEQAGNTDLARLANATVTAK